MKLYYLKTRKFGAYVLGETVDKAIEKFTQWANEEDYGFSDDRIVVESKLIADSGVSYPYNGVTNNFEKLFL